MSVSIIFKSRISTPYTARTHSYTVNIQAASIYLVYVNWYKCQSYLNLPPPSPPPSSSHILANLKTESFTDYAKSLKVVIVQASW